MVIATHNGIFHADDVFAVAALFAMLETSPVASTVIRTRDEDAVRKADFVVDVGGEYDALKNRFDHHQLGGAGKRKNGISYASFGLVWQKFGELIAESPKVAEMVDKKLVVVVDANDTGADVWRKVVSDVTPYGVSDYVHSIRPTWQESAESLDERFLEAVGFARKVLEREIAHAKAIVAAEVLVRQVYEKAADKRVVVFDKEYPCEVTLATFPEPLFTVSPRADGSWHLKTVRDDVSTFKNRLDLPEPWAGLREEALVKVTGVSDAVFCHTNRFMAVTRTREGAVALAQKALMS